MGPVRWAAMAGLSIVLVSATEAVNAQVEAYGYLAVSEFDARILIRADELLADHAAWNQIDDRECADDEQEGKRSLFCALQKAAIDVTGVYDHRSAAIQEVRRVVEELTPGRRFSHPIMNFNNRAEIRFSDIKRVLSIALERIQAQVKTAD